MGVMAKVRCLCLCQCLAVTFYKMKPTTNMRQRMTPKTRKKMSSFNYQYETDNDSQNKKENVIIQQTGDNKLKMIEGNGLEQQELTRDDYINQKNPKISNVHMHKDSNQINMEQDMDQEQAKQAALHHQHEVKSREKQKQPYSHLKEGNQEWWNERKRDSFKARRLLFERALGDGCLSHKTAVAAGALTQYLRFMIDPGPQEYREAVSLNGINRLMRTELPNEETANEKEAENAKPNMIDLDEKTFQEVKDPHVENNDDANENKEEEDEDGEDENEDEGLEKEEEDYYEDANKKNNMDPNNQPDEERHKKFLPKPWQEHAQDQGDKEYEQYIDEEAFKKDRAAIIQPRPHLEIAADKAHRNHEKYTQEDDYNYYDNKKAPNEQELSDDLDDNALEDRAISGPHPTGAGRMDNQPIEAHRDSLHGMMPPKFDAGGVGTVYLIMFSTTVVLLYLMYRFVKKRRIVIRYRYR